MRRRVVDSCEPGVRRFGLLVEAIQGPSDPVRIGLVERLSDFSWYSCHGPILAARDYCRISEPDPPPTTRPGTRAEKLSLEAEAIGKFTVIYADPPWANDNSGLNGAAWPSHEKRAAPNPSRERRVNMTKTAKTLPHETSCGLHIDGHNMLP